MVMEIDVEKFMIGERYNWRNQPERLIYLGRQGCWYQFALVENPDKVWCEVLEEHTHMIEETIS